MILIRQFQTEALALVCWRFFLTNHMKYSNIEYVVSIDEKYLMGQNGYTKFKCLARRFRSYKEALEEKNRRGLVFAQIHKP